ncbi:ferritin-like domain-containing protein [Microbacterium deminutum]|uniref:Ferritin-like domain-containing protein n=1 Tax=Microbacterium deminutum TaxID=344164 RepID=A0ABP5CK04_9MICO
MFDDKFITNAIKRSGETALDRRRLLTMAGIAGVGAASLLVAAEPATAATPATTGSSPSGAPSDASILNFALNLEYLEAEFYLRAVTGEGLPDNMTTGTGTRGPVTGGRKVPFKTPVIRKYAQEIASDEKNHVAFLRGALGSAAVSRPAISLDASFTAAATAAGLIMPGQKFDPYANELNFLFAAFLFEDVGVTAYKGAAPFIQNKTYLDAAAGLLAVEAYHAGIIRTTLYAEGIFAPNVYASVDKLSNARDSLDGPTDDDQGIGNHAVANLVPTDANSLAYSRTTGQVLNIVYLNPAPVRSGGFFPAGVNGSINTSA